MMPPTRRSRPPSLDPLADMLGAAQARRRLAALTLAVVFVLAWAVGGCRPAYGSSNWRARPGCQRIEQAFLAVGAPAAVADRFAYRIAPRESSCRPVFVHDHDDWSHSTVGLNGKTRALRRGWMRLCGHDVRTWDGYETDARCALAAWEAMGWRPWR